MNSCTFVGRLAADAKTDTTPNGTAVLKFRLASDTGYGERKKTHWLNCAMFGERGTKLAPYLKKGTSVTAILELDPPRIYEASGEQRIAQDATVRDIALQGKREDDQGGGSGQAAGMPSRDFQAPPASNARAYAEASGRAAPAAGAREDFGDDIPF